MIRIITDSAADMTAAELRALRVDLISMPLTIGEDNFDSSDSLSLDEFWTRMEAGEVAKTSQPSPEAFLSYFQNAADAGDSVVYITLSSALSGTFQSAIVAKDLIDNADIHIVDSLFAAAAQKIMVMHACRLRDEGKLSAAQIAEEIVALRSRVKLYASLNTLDYLARGGRIPQAAASIAGLVHLKALISLSEDGHVALVGKALGISRSFTQIMNLMARHEIDPDFPIIPIYSHVPHNCQSFIQKLSAKSLPRALEAPMPIGVTIGTHIGPQAYGIVFVAKA